MGHAFAEIDLSNPRKSDLDPVRVKALADTGALMLCIPEHIALQLKLETESTREVSVADGRSMNVPYVGPIRVSFGKRICFVGALVLGDEVLLGAVPMEDMDLVISPSRREVTVDPASPNIPHARVKSLTSRLCIPRIIKQYLIVSFLLFGTALNGFAENLFPQSRITAVTVYPGSARVTRQAKVDLSAGEHSIVFENIIPQLDENSLTVTGKGTAAVKIFGAYIKREYSEKAADQRVRELEALIEKLADQIQTENNNLEILRKEREFLDSVKLFSGQQIPKDLVTAMPSVETLEGVRNFLSGRFTDVEKRKETVRIKMRELRREQEVAQRQLNELRGSSSQQQRQLVVDLECAKQGKFTLDVSYLVHGAYWHSVYDARADYDKSEVELTSFGVIKQTTGEDWEGVQLTLSTAQPTVSGRMPYVSSWILQPYQPQRREAKAQLRMPMKSAMRASDDIGGQYESYMFAEEAPGAPAEVEAQLAYSQVEQKGISVVYKIARPATIKSDGSENKYPVSSQVLKANFEYSSYPRLTPFAYLGSRVVNSEDLQLLAGEVNLFLEGDYIGKSSVDNIGPGEEFNLYLGVDENVKVKREQISRKVDDVLLAGIKSPNRKTTFQYKLTVENYKNKKIAVHLFEAVPVSQNERIRVKTFDVSRGPQDMDWKDRKGVWRWEFALEPKAKQEIYYSFSVDHPRDMNVPGI